MNLGGFWVDFSGFQCVWVGFGWVSVGLGYIWVGFSGFQCVVPPVPSPDFSFPADEHLDVYVSAAESPGHFWIQLLGTRSLQLDKLTAEMGHFYQSSPPVSALSPLCHLSVTCVPSVSPHVPPCPSSDKLTAEMGTF